MSRQKLGSWLVRGVGEGSMKSDVIKTPNITRGGWPPRLRLLYENVRRSVQKSAQVDGRGNVTTTLVMNKVGVTIGSVEHRTRTQAGHLLLGTLERYGYHIHKYV